MNEAKELSRLMKAVTKQLNEDNDRYEADMSGDFNISEAIIVIGDEAIRLSLGGPQVAGIHAMIQHIADENMYTVDYVNDTVSEEHTGNDS